MANLFKQSIVTGADARANLQVCLFIESVSSFVSNYPISTCPILPNGYNFTWWKCVLTFLGIRFWSLKTFLV